jgi:hypothetical protein
MLEGAHIDDAEGAIDTVVLRHGKIFTLLDEVPIKLEKGLIVISAVCVVVEVPTLPDMREPAPFVHTSRREPPHHAAGFIGEPFFGAQRPLLVERRNKLVSMTRMTLGKLLGAGELNSYRVERHSIVS